MVGELPQRIGERRERIPGWRDQECEEQAPGREAGARWARGSGWGPLGVDAATRLTCGVRAGERAWTTSRGAAVSLVRREPLTRLGSGQPRHGDRHTRDGVSECRSRRALFPAVLSGLSPLLRKRISTRVSPDRVSQVEQHGHARRRHSVGWAGPWDEETSAIGQRPGCGQPPWEAPGSRRGRGWGTGTGRPEAGREEDGHF